MRVRGYREEDKGELAHLLALAFGDTDPAWKRHLDPGVNRRLDPDLVYVAEEDGGPRATASVLPLQSYVDGREVPTGGLTIVATHPAYRRRGFAAALLRQTLYAMRERGLCLSTLEPFAHAFYRASGWELVSEDLCYDLSPAELSTSPEQTRLRVYQERDQDALSSLLEEEAARYPLCVRRGRGRWRELLSGGPDAWDRSYETVVYERGGAVEGYAIYRQKKAEVGSGRVLEVPELVGRTRRAWEALMSFMAAYDRTEWRIRHRTPPGEPLHPFLESSYVRMTVEPTTMLRLVDVEAALSRLPRPVPEPLVLDVTDDVMPENAGAYTIDESGVSRGAEAAERVALDVRELARLYAGYLPARRLASRGLVTPGSGRALELLDATFPPKDPWTFPLDRF